MAYIIFFESGYVSVIDLKLNFWVYKYSSLACSLKRDRIQEKTSMYLALFSLVKRG